MGIDPRLRLLAVSRTPGRLHIREVKKVYGGDDRKAAKAVHWLDREGLAFPISRGLYATPSADLRQPLSGKDPLERLASWLPRWIREHSEETLLPEGLRWAESSFLELAVRASTQLRWAGPTLLVPIEPGTPRLGRVYNRMSVLAADTLYPAQKSRLSNGVSAPMPYKRELVRLLSVHSDPRLLEAALEVPISDRNRRDLEPIISRTDPPMPFPSPQVRLPPGPPFRYRVYAPLRWVRRNLQYSHPTRGRRTRTSGG